MNSDTDSGLRPRETRECPCYRLVHPLRSGETLPDHVCRLTMRDSCARYLRDEGLAVPGEGRPGGPLRFGMAPGWVVEIERPGDWPWAVRASEKSVLMVLRQIVEHKRSPRNTKLLTGHGDWDRAKQSLSMSLWMSEASLAFSRWRQENPQSAGPPESLSRRFEPPTIHFEEPPADDPGRGMGGQRTSGDGEGESLNSVSQAPAESPALLPEPDRTGEPDCTGEPGRMPDLPPRRRLSVPLGVSADELRRLALMALRSHNLSDTDSSIDLLLSEVLPAPPVQTPPPLDLANSVFVTSFLIGDGNVILTASMIADEERDIQIMEGTAPAAASARRQAGAWRTPPQLIHRGEAIFAITGSSVWAKPDTIKAASATVTAHQDWWARLATREAINTDRRRIAGRRRLDEPDEGEKTEELKDIEAYLSHALTEEQVRRRAHQRVEQVQEGSLSPIEKAAVNRSLARKIRYRRDKAGVAEEESAPEGAREK